MKLSHTFSSLSVTADEPNLIGVAGLIPAVGLAQQLGVSQLLAEHVRLRGGDVGSAAANPHLKGMSLIAAMIAGADSIEDTDLLRHGGMDRVFAGVRAPSTLGTHLRAFSLGGEEEASKLQRYRWSCSEPTRSARPKRPGQLERDMPKRKSSKTRVQDLKRASVA